ncbi:MAG: SusD/RagB family nutrient-binding outer membrane lipoprotein [Bacteroidetes bacterium]|nr:SusD/RagB family nutrient-binding outer membrane lipoprotein [Bacteroidota bacterium]
MNYIKFIIGILGISLFMGLSSCKKTFDALLNNPNYPSPSTADVDLYLNEVQVSFKDFWNTASDYGAQLTRQQQWYGPFYRNGYTPATFDFMWTTAYASVIKNAQAMVPLAQSQKKYIQSGIARILEAYTYGTLVDDFGDVPFGEANLGAASTNPKVDPGATTYAGVQTLLDSAIADLQKTGAATGPANDLYYSGSAANWITLAKTLKLKYYMQVRLVDQTAAASIQALLSENNLINNPSQDFVFKYGTNITAPDSRHPHYGLDYANSGGVGEYIGNYMMWAVAAEKWGGNVNLTGDPRLRYYFYRQATNYAWANQQSCPCYSSSYFQTPNYPSWYPSVPDKTPFCVVGKGYTGRDHGDNSGTPPDVNFRTAWGIYPAGGQFDANQGAAVTLTMGGQGAGISPIWLSSFTSFVKAEAALVLGSTGQGTPRSLLLSGISASISKVLAFPSTVNYTVPSNYIPSNSAIASYDSLVASNYDTASSNDSRLNIIMTEYYIAAWGNGLETYNNYRLTGMPNNMQLAKAVPEPGFFMRSFYYPSVFENRNSNAPVQKTPGDAVQKVFWDNNPDNFIN